MYQITKQQKNINNFKVNMYYFNRARDSFEYILKNILKNKTILIPAYIGHSSREGSGIFDPIKNSNINYKLYELESSLDINLTNLYQLIKDTSNCVLLLVHYFGFADREITKIREYAKDNGVIIVEDCAHSFFTFFQDSKIESDYYIFSLHKMLPYNSGGLLISKNNISINTNILYNPFEYNINKISKKRIENYNYLKKKVKNVNGIRIVYDQLNNNIPQTFPILLESEKIRDMLYFKLNEEGFGVVSLYHELIKEIDINRYTNENYISKHILNLPIHQDVNIENIDKMFFVLINLLENK